MTDRAAGARPGGAAQTVLARLRLVSSLSDLRPERRLDAKLDMSASGVTSRLKEVSELLLACHALARAGSSLRESG